MKPSTVLVAAAASTLAIAQDAPITQNNPTMASIQANLQANKDVQGTITGVSNTNGTGVNFNINFFSFPSTGGPFTYYIASSAVPSSDDCSSLTSPFNPYAGSSKCNAEDPASCPIGALSAKHGTIPTTDSSFQKFYLDLYLSTESGTEAYFAAKSIVVADKSGKPLNCANFVASGTGNGNASGTSFNFGAGSTSTTKVASSAAGTGFSFGAGPTSTTKAASSSAAGTGFSFGAGPSSTSAAVSATSSAAAVMGRGVGEGMALLAAVAALVV